MGYPPLLESMFGQNRHTDTQTEEEVQAVRTNLVVGHICPSRVGMPSCAFLYHLVLLELALDKPKQNYIDGATVCVYPTTKEQS